MLPTKLSRAAQRATASPPTSTCYACLAKQRTHQRRHSSSKASSSSADRYSNKPAGPAAKAGTPAPASGEGEQTAAGTSSTSASTPTPAQETRTPTRSSKGRTRLPRRTSGASAADGGKKAVPAAEQEERFTKLPSVPSVQSLSESERSISNFFSLHRPMSITHTFPPPSSAESFSKIFTTTPPPSDPWANGNSAERRPEDVIYTLNSTIENLENRYNSEQGGEGEGEGVRWEIIQEGSEGNGRSNAGGVHHLDGQPRGAGVKMNLEELVAQFKPFRAPPPPVPFPEYETAKSKQKERKAVQQASTASAQESIVKPKQKTFTTTITVTESTYANGRKTYTASSGPIISQAVQDAESSTISSTSDTPRRLTRRERVRKMRQDAASASSQDMDAQTPGTSVNGVISTIRRAPIGERERRMGRTMFLISVKRQRKLKMKKHKYKKLMKRTRNLRRRLERN